MLIRFSWKNFLNFNETEDGSTIEFSPLAGRVRKKPAHVCSFNGLNVLKFAAIYGANASGKSNVVRALEFFKYLVMTGAFPIGSSESWCRTQEDNRTKPSYFELEFVVAGEIYAYGFELLIATQKIISEWLYKLSKDEETLIFERTVSEGSCKLGEDAFLAAGQEFRTRLEMYLSDYSDNDSRLFLNYINLSGLKFVETDVSSPVLKQVFRWIGESLVIISPNSEWLNPSIFEKSTTDPAVVCQYLKAFGTGIDSYVLENVPFEKVLSTIPVEIKGRFLKDIEDAKVRVAKHDPSGEPYKFFLRTMQSMFIIHLEEVQSEVCPIARELLFTHEHKGFKFRLGEESDGSRRILSLLDVFLSSEPKVYVIDEIDRCLHPNMTYAYINNFLERVSENAQKAPQLIVTSHESRLLDFDLLRRDEVWFVEKNKKGEADLYSLEEFNERFDKKVDKAYLEGRYGGVPVFTTLFPIR